MTMCRKSVIVLRVPSCIESSGLPMPRLFAHFLKALVAVFALAAIAPAFAQTKPSSLVGKSRDQIVAQLGEPKSNIKAGSREMLFFAHLKVTLKNDVVIETEELTDEPGPRHAAEPPVNSSALPGANPAQTGAATPANASAPTPPPANPDAANAPTVKPATDSGATPAGPPAPPSEAPLEIKFVKSGASSGKAMPRPQTVAPATTPQPAPTKPTAIATPELPSTSPQPVVTIPPTPQSIPTESKNMAATNPPAVALAAEQPKVAEETPETESAPSKPAVDAKKKAALRRHWWIRRVAESDDEPVEFFSTQSYVIAAIVMIGGMAYLWWQRMQRGLALAATTVSSTPFEATAVVDDGAQFTSELLSKLDAKRFERLVAAYYAKTGVVAKRTNSGPRSAVHIEIFWKGEPKPFAGVQCHANPPLLINAKPLQDLFAALSSAEIRRGYVVTSGKFNVEARDFASEKNFTLLTGDIFLEKLNALPPPVRAELLKETNAVEPA